MLLDPADADTEDNNAVDPMAAAIMAVARQNEMLSQAVLALTEEVRTLCDVIRRNENPPAHDDADGQPE